MTRVIVAVIILVALIAGWSFMQYAKKYEEVGGHGPAEVQQTHPVRAEDLPGMPYGYQATLDIAMKQGGPAVRQWLNTYGKSVPDPRKAWIELDYCRLIARDDPNEAKRIFDAVKKRTPPNSPVSQRIQEMSGTFD